VTARQAGDATGDSGRDVTVTARKLLAGRSPAGPASLRAFGGLMSFGRRTGLHRITQRTLAGTVPTRASRSLLRGAWRLPGGVRQALIP
jgi:hypothetical protein